MTWGAWGEGPKLTVAMTTSAYVEVFISAVEVDDGPQQMGESPAHHTEGYL